MVFIFCEFHSLHLLHFDFQTHLKSSGSATFPHSPIKDLNICLDQVIKVLKMTQIRSLRYSIVLSRNLWQILYVLAGLIRQI